MNKSEIYDTYYSRLASKKQLQTRGDLDATAKNKATSFNISVNLNIIYPLQD